MTVQYPVQYFSTTAAVDQQHSAEKRNPKKKVPAFLIHNVIKTICCFCFCFAVSYCTVRIVRSTPLLVQYDTVLYCTQED